MTQVLCARIACPCGESMVWAAQVAWLEQEGVAAAFPRGQRLPLPKDARDVTGLFTLRCPRCFQILPTVPLLRARFLAGATTLVRLPAVKGDLRPGGSAPGETNRTLPSRLTAREGRRGRRVRAEPGLRALLSSALPVTILDLSTGGLCAEHPQRLEPGSLCTLCLQLPGHAEAFRLQARVRWSQPHRVEQTFGARTTMHRSGFQFLKVGPDTRTVLEAYVAARFEGGASAPSAAVLPG